MMDISGTTLDVMVPALHALIGTEMTAAICFHAQAGRLDVQDARCVNVPAVADLVRRCRVLVESLCNTLDAVTPQAPPELRNRVLLYECGDPVNDNGPPGGRLSLPAQTDRPHRQMALMICERSVPLAWIGGWQTQDFDADQRRLLASLVGPLRRWLIDRSSKAPGPDPLETMVERATAHWRLTSRQEDVLDLLARGLTNALIAAELAIAERTVEFHVSAIFDKAGVDNRTTLIARLFS